MGVWQAIELLNTLVDDSDPDVRSFSRSFRDIITHTTLLSLYSFHTADIAINAIFPYPTYRRIIMQTSVSQIEHLLQTAEAIRRDGKPEWMQVRKFAAFN